MMQGRAGIDQIELRIPEASHMRGIHGKSADTIRDTIGRGTAQRNLNGNRRKIYQSHRRSFSCHPYTPFTKPTSVVQHRAPSELLREELPEDSTVQQATLVKQAAWISQVPLKRLPVGDQRMVWCVPV